MKKWISLSLIRLGVNLNPVWFFQNCIFYRKSEALLFYKGAFLHIFSQVTFYIIKSHIPEIFIEITQVVQNIWGFSSSILATFYLFLDSSPWYKETNNVTIALSYFHHTLNRLINPCFKLIRLRKSFWNMKREGVNKKTSFEKPSLTRVNILTGSITKLQANK